VGGAHVGFNYQFGSLVAGIEADIEGAGIEGDNSFDFVGGALDGTTLSASSEINFQGSLRARVGFALDRALIYATGGLAFANFENSYVLSETATGVSLGSQNFDETEWGWTLGAGVEYAFTNNLTARVEYRYTQFDGFRNEGTGVFAGSAADLEPDFHTVRVGLSYKF
jgi:outer membrane immunogenic protein